MLLFHLCRGTTVSCKLLRDDVVRVARSYLNTPFVHQGRLPLIGLDCIGLPACCARDLGIDHTDCTRYSRRPIGVLIDKLKESGLIRQDDMRLLAARIVVFWIRKDRGPQHLAIVTEEETKMIHTHMGVGKVVEHRIDDAWRNRIHSVWEYPVKWQPQ